MKRRVPAEPELSPVASRIYAVLPGVLEPLGGSCSDVPLTMKVLWALPTPRPAPTQILEGLRELERRGKLLRQDQELRLPPPPPRMDPLFDLPDLV